MCSEDKELNQVRSKTDPVDRPVRTAHIFVHHCNSTHYCNTETVLLIFKPTSHLRCGGKDDKIGSRNIWRQTIAWYLLVAKQQLPPCWRQWEIRRVVGRSCQAEAASSRQTERR